MDLQGHNSSFSSFILKNVIQVTFITIGYRIGHHFNSSSFFVKILLRNCLHLDKVYINYKYPFNNVVVILLLSGKQPPNPKKKVYIQSSIISSQIINVVIICITIVYKSKTQYFTFWFSLPLFVFRVLFVAVGRISFISSLPSYHLLTDTALAR